MKPGRHGDDHSPDGEDPIPGLIGALHYGDNINRAPTPNWLNVEVNGDGTTIAGGKPIGFFVTGSWPGGFGPDAIVLEHDSANAGLIRISNNTSAGSGIKVENNGDLTGTGRPGVDIENNADADSGQPAMVVSNNGTGDMLVNNNAGRLYLFAGAGGLMEIEGAGGIQLDPDAGFLTILDLPTSNPGGTHRVWNNGGVLSIT